MAQQTRIIFQEDNKFNKPNILINVVKSKELGLKDKKVYNVLLRKLIDQDLINYQTNTIKTSITEIARMLNTTHRSDIHDALDKLEETRIVFDHLIDEEEYTTKTRLISSNSVHKRNEDSVVIEFSRFLTKEILLHNKRYTKLDLIEMNKLKVGHSLTLYELIKSKLYKYKYQYQNYTEEELRKFLNLENKYLNVKQFNQKVVKKMIDDINDNTELDLTLLKTSKRDNVRTYHFQVKYEDFNISPQTFRNTLREVKRKMFKNISFTNGKQKFILEENSDFGNEKEVNNLYWINEKNDKTVSTDMADFIWEELYKQYRNDWYNFIENKLGIDIEDWVKTERNYIQ
jgi:plasmid replication initiation protein